MGEHMTRTEFDRRPAEPWWLAGREHDDVFPWAFTRYLDADGGKDGIGSITTPNGRFPDGRMHTYWMVAGGMWEPDALLVCTAVNAYVAKGWRGWVIRRLSPNGSKDASGGSR